MGVGLLLKFSQRVWIERASRRLNGWLVVVEVLGLNCVTVSDFVASGAIVGWGDARQERTSYMQAGKRDPLLELQYTNAASIKTTRSDDDDDGSTKHYSI